MKKFIYKTEQTHRHRKQAYGYQKRKQGKGKVGSLGLKHICIHSTIYKMGFLGGLMVKNLPAKQEMWLQSLGQEGPLEKERATHSSVLAWEIPWTEEPSRLQSMGLQKSQQDLATKTMYYHVFLDLICYIFIRILSSLFGCIFAYNFLS